MQYLFIIILKLRALKLNDEILILNLKKKNKY